MMGRFIDIKGDKYNRWTVLAKTKNRDAGGSVMWECRCDCGTIREVSANSLRDGSSRSCGCSKLKNKTVADVRKENEYFFDGCIVYSYTTNTGNKFYFDRDIYNKVKQYSWHENSNGYVVSSTYKGINGSAVFLHSLVLDVNNEDGLFIDHINGDKMNNLKSNIREVSYSQNAMNTGVRRDNRSGHRGLFYKKKSKTWFAYINKNKQRVNLGHFKDKDKAIKQREIAELYLFAEYSRDYNYLKEKYKDVDIIEYLQTHAPKCFEVKPLK